MSMTTYDRSGYRVAALKIGGVKCLRQEIVLPGETWDSSVVGEIRLGALREQMTTDIHVGLYKFFCPIRYLVDSNQFVELLKARNREQFAVLFTSILTPGNLSDDFLGLGRLSRSTSFNNYSVPAVFYRNIGAIYEWFFKHPDDFNRRILPSFTTSHTLRLTNLEHAAFPWSLSSDVSIRDLYAKYGFPALHLAAGITRSRSADDVENNESADADVISGSQLELQQLAKAHAQFRQDQMRDWMINEDVFREVLDEVYGKKIQDNVDMKPFLLDERTQWLGGRNQYATDADNLGNVSGIMEASVNHDTGRFAAPEHGILSYFLVLRVPPIWTNEHSPWVDGIRLNNMKDELLFDPVSFEGPPEPLRLSSFIDTPSSQTAYYPKMQRLRLGFNHVDDAFRTRDSFPFHTERNIVGDNFNNYRYVDLSDMDHAFQSLSLGHAVAKLKITQMVDSPLPAPGASVLTGDGND